MAMKRTGTNPVNISRVKHPTELLRYQRMGRELRVMDQLLSPDIDSVSIIEGGPAPAWTSADGADVTINVSNMPPLNSRRDIAVWLGTNAHELWHNKYSPRADSRLMRRVAAAPRSTDPGIHRCWNVLEDQRIERLGLSRFAAWRGYLIAALAHHIPVSSPNAWTLVAGRTWLSSESRAIARAVFVATNGEADAKRCAELIGAYQRLADPGEDDADEAWLILTEFHGLFGMQIPPRGSCGGAGHVEEGEPETVDDDDVSYPTADEADEYDGDDESGSDDDDGDGDEGDSPGDDADGGSDGDGDDDADDDGDGDGDSDEGDGDSDDGDGSGESDEGDDADGDDADGDGDTDGGDGDGTGDDDGGESDDIGDKGDGDEPGDGTSAPDGERDISESIADDIDDALGDDEVAADLDRVVDNLAHGTTGPGNLPRTTGVWEEADVEARLLARDVTAVLSDIRDDCEASWLRRTDTGRFSVDRWATDPDWDADNVFDLFDPGAMDASSLELILVLDVSSSMRRQNRLLSMATWAIRQAVDRVEGKVTCIGFGDDASLMFDAGQRPDGRIFIPHLEGSTDATNALREAYRVVTDSQATNRIILVLTDGQWWGADVAGRALVAAGDEGAVTCVVGMGSEGKKAVTPNFAGAQHTAHIDEASELVPVFKALAEASMLAAMGGR